MFERNLYEFRTITIGQKRLDALLRDKSEQLRQESASKLAELDKSDIAIPDEVRIKIPTFDCSDSPNTRKRRKLVPLETYEQWHQIPSLNKNIELELEGDAEGDGDNANRKRKKGEEEEDEEGAEEEEEEETFKVDTKDNAPFEKIHFLVKTSGLEVLPHSIPETKSEEYDAPALSTILSYSRRHTLLLSKLLHINVLRRKWMIAYKCFAMLIRLPSVDIRSIWPIGLEILVRLSEEEYKANIPEGTFDEYEFKTDANILQTFKDEQFLNWLETFYPITTKLSLDSPKNLVPTPYRTGARTAAPLYVLTLIWTMVTRQKFKQINDKLATLLTRKPFINEGIFYFLQGFSYQLEAIKLSKEDHMDKQTIERLLLDSEKFYAEAKSREAMFPEELLKKQADSVKARLSEIIEFEQDHYSDTKYESNDDGYFSNNSFDNYDRVRNPDSDFEDDFDRYNNRSNYDEFED